MEPLKIEYHVEWENICRNLNKDYKITELKKIAEIQNINTNKKTKRELCAELSKKASKLIINIDKCHNKDIKSKIQKELIFSFKDENKTYCFNILNLIYMIDKQDKRNPYTNNKLPVKKIKEQYKKLEKILLLDNIIDKIKLSPIKSFNESDEDDFRTDFSESLYVYRNKYEKKQCEYLAGLSKDTLESLHCYMTDNYHVIHNILRKGKYTDPDFQYYDCTTDMDETVMIKHIDKAIKNSPKTTKDIFVYRGVDLDNYSFFDKSFISTSYKKITPIEFMTMNKNNKNPGLLKIKVPKNSNILNLYCIYDFQHEVLLPRNSYFTIDKKTKRKKGNLK